MIESVFSETAVMLLLAAALGIVAMQFKQPLIIAYIAVGLLAGPSVLGIADADNEIKLLAELGIALLLFIVGLRLDLHLIRSVGPVALATGVGQVVFTSVLGFAIGSALGLPVGEAAFVGLALTFSSTIIIVKLLSDKREIDELHGRIAVGFLIVQDIIVILAMIALTAAGGDSDRSPAVEFAYVALKGTGFLVAVALAARYALGPLLRRLSHSPEVLMLFAIAWAVSLAAASEALGFSIEVGAFLGGVSLASTDFRDAISARMVGLRDFLLLFFFINLGISVELGGVEEQIGLAVVLSIFVLIAKPLIVLAIMGLMGYRRRVTIMTSLTVGQVSEFSLILAALGLSLGQIDPDTVALITAVAVITITFSTYTILFTEQLFSFLGPRLGLFERDVPDDRGLDDDPAEDIFFDVLVLGLGRYGSEVARRLTEDGYRVAGMDFDPVALENWEKTGNRAIYGDVEDPEMPSLVPLDRIRWIVSSVPRREVSMVLLHALEHHNFEGRVAVTAHHDSDAELLEQSGADLVLRPFLDAANAIIGKIEND